MNVEQTETLRAVAATHGVTIEGRRYHDDEQSTRLRASNGMTFSVSSYYDEDHYANVSRVLDCFIETGSFYRKGN